MIKQQDALEFMKEQGDYSADLIFQDPPYDLGSKIVIKENDKPRFSKLYKL